MAKPVFWMGSSHKDIQELPDEIQHEFGFALWEVQRGEYPRNAKPLHGFGGGGVLEIRGFAAMRIGPSTPSDSQKLFTCFTCFKRNPSPVRRFRKKTSP